MLATRGSKIDPDHFFFSEVPATHRRRNLTTSERTWYLYRSRLDEKMGCEYYTPERHKRVFREFTTANGGTQFSQLASSSYVGLL